MVGEESARKSAPSEEVVGALAASGGGGLADVEEGADGEEESGEGRGGGVVGLARERGTKGDLWRGRGRT